MTQAKYIKKSHSGIKQDSEKDTRNNPVLNDGLNEGSNQPSKPTPQYFQKLKCECHCHNCCKESVQPCCDKGIIAGADITSTIKPIFQFIIKNEWVLCDCVAKQVKDYQNRKQVKYGDYNHNTEVCPFEKIKQTIEENTIKVE